MDRVKLMRVVVIPLAAIFGIAIWTGVVTLVCQYMEKDYPLVQRVCIAVIFWLSVVVTRAVFKSVSEDR